MNKMGKEDNDKLKELFRRAAEETNSRPEAIKDETVYEATPFPVFMDDDNSSLQEKVMQFTEAGITKWDILSNRMDGDFADRFMKEMEQLSGREFVRTYLKMLEYFRPKIVRVENTKDEEKDTVIKVQVFNNYEEVQNFQEDDD